MTKVKAKRLKAGAPRRRRIPWLRWLLVLVVVLAAWVIHLDVAVREKFEGRRWQVPAQVFAQPLELYAGAPFTLKRVVAALDQLGYGRVDAVQQPGEYAIGGSQLQVFVRSFRHPEQYQPAQRIGLRFDSSGVASIATGEGQTDWIRFDPMRIAGIYPQSGEDRVLASLDEVPSLLVKALLAVEDRDFHSHWGVSPASIARALWVNLKSGSVVQGGSTITQQLVKNFYLDDSQTVVRKVNEAIMALLLEVHYSKDEILETYLNEVFLGQSGRRAIHGFGQGSHFYFGKPLQDLAPDQMALLVGLVKGPSYFDPRRHPQRSLDRRNLVLRMMEAQALLDADELHTLVARPLKVIAGRQGSADLYPGFLALVRKQLALEYSPEVLRSEGLRIFTTLDPIVQQKAEESLSAMTAHLQGRARDNADLQGAMLVTSHASGEIVALVAGSDPRFSGFNRALDASRPVGSLIKPVIAAAALREGGVTLASPLDDTGFKLVFEDGSEWQPENFDHAEHGKVLLYAALARSYNLAFTRLGLDTGIPRVIETLHALGADAQPQPYPATLLGAVNMTPYEVTQLYQNLLGGGFGIPLRSIRAVTQADGSLASRYLFETRQVVSPQVAYLVQHGLVAVVREGTGKGVYQRVSRDTVLGGKSGTTNDNRDSWFVGFDGRYLATVWLGKDDNGATSLTGSTGALKVWEDFLVRQGASSWVPVQPEGIIWKHVEDVSGRLSAEGCPGVVHLPFIEGSEPVEPSECARDGVAIDSVRRWWQNIFQ